MDYVTDHRGYWAVSETQQSRRDPRIESIQNPGGRPVNRVAKTPRVSIFTANDAAADRHRQLARPIRLASGVAA